MILRRRTLEAMKAKIQAAYNFLSPLRDRLISGEPGKDAEDFVRRSREAPCQLRRQAQSQILLVAAAVGPGATRFARKVPDRNGGRTG